MRWSSLAAMFLLASFAAEAAEPKTKAAVVAADDAWLNAEVTGNGDYLDELILPEYLSVNADGTATSKAQIVARSRGRTKEELARLNERVAAWKAAHPVRADVTIAGDTAILRWIKSDSTGRALVSSSDIFLYRDGRWHAIYSQHTSAPN